MGILRALLLIGLYSLAGTAGADYCLWAGKNAEDSTRYTVSSSVTTMIERLGIDIPEGGFIWTELEISYEGVPEALAALIIHACKKDFGVFGPNRRKDAVEHLINF